MAVYRGMDIGTAKPTPEERAEVPYHLIDLVDPDRGVHRPAVPGGTRAAPSRGMAGRGHGALLVGGTGLYLRSLVDDLEFPGRFPEVAARSKPSSTPPGRGARPESRRPSRPLHGRLADLDPVAAGRIEPSNRRRLVRALEVTMGRVEPFSSFGPGLERVSRRPRWPWSGSGLDPADLDRRIAERFAD